MGDMCTCRPKPVTRRAAAFFVRLQSVQESLGDAAVQYITVEVGDSRFESIHQANRFMGPN